MPYSGRVWQIPVGAEICQIIQGAAVIYRCSLPGRTLVELPDSFICQAAR
ncbi:hypothetical protein [Pantoea sp. BAV 3049]|nr:hypothetical protein [Pantoea sp. BAV 3049]